MKTYTIGFTKKSAEYFFTSIKESGIKTLIDVRLNNISQLSGFAKRDDITYFLKMICDTNYVHIPDFAPTKKMLEAYRKGTTTWQHYEEQFLDLLAVRNAERIATPELIENGCFLCSEHEPHLCHRRLVVEYLNKQLNLSLEVKHLI